MSSSVDHRGPSTRKGGTADRRGNRQVPGRVDAILVDLDAQQGSEKPPVGVGLGGKKKKTEDEVEFNGEKGDGQDVVVMRQLLPEGDGRSNRV